MIAQWHEVEKLKAYFERIHREIIVVLLVAMMAGCEESSVVESKIDYKAQFEKSDAAIGKYLDKLDAPSTPPKVKEKILCKSYPDEYKHKYMPALLATSKDYTEEKLLSDMKAATNYYKKKLGIKCY